MTPSGSFEISALSGVGPVKFGMLPAVVDSVLSEAGRARIDNDGVGTATYFDVALVVDFQGEAGAQMVTVYPELDAKFEDITFAGLSRGELIRKLNDKRIRWIDYNEEALILLREGIVVGFDDDAMVRNVSVNGSVHWEASLAALRRTGLID